MSRSIIVSTALVAVASFAGLAGATGVATFADPALNGSTPLFTFNAGLGSLGALSGSWNGNGLLLQTPGEPASPDFANAHFSMAPVFVTNIVGPGPLYLLGPGNITFTDNLNVPQLIVNFQSATLNGSLNFGGADFQGNNVTFSGPILAPFVVSGEQFSFSFANALTPPTPGVPPAPGSYTVTSSFTSSATLQPVPSPGAVALLGFGALVISRRKR